MKINWKRATLIFVLTSVLMFPTTLYFRDFIFRPYAETVLMLPTAYPTKQPYIAPLQTEEYVQFYLVNVYAKDIPQYTICADQYIIHIKWQVSQDIYFYIDDVLVGEVKDFQEMTVFPMSQEQCELYLGGLDDN